jgi:hypothetical protein
MSEKK